MPAPTFAAAKAGYENLWARMQITRVAAVTGAAKRCIAGKPRYLAVETATGVPWYVISLMHLRESNLDWRGVLHNGEKILGTGRKTRLVPKGRGPFSTWEEAAIDALKIKRYPPEWDIAHIAYAFEKFNGFGYRSKGIPSPYLWGGSNIQRPGKYVRDGVYDASVMDTQLGCMTVLRKMMDLDPSIMPDSTSAKTEAEGADTEVADLPEAEAPEAEAPQVAIASTAPVGFWRKVTGWLTAAATSAGAFLWDWRVAAALIIGFVVVAGLVLFMIWMLGLWPDLKASAKRLFRKE